MRHTRSESGLREPLVPQALNDGQRASNRLFSELASVASREAGRAWMFAFALGIILVWAITGPWFNFSDTWQLVINTGTTIVTFLMVFLIQNSQNRDAAAIQVKLDELIRVSKAQNSFIGLEHLTEEELEVIRRRCEEAAKAEVAARGTPAAEKKEARWSSSKPLTARGIKHRHANSSTK
jgi:low affinity Fe/Cu permease